MQRKDNNYKVTKLISMQRKDNNYKVTKLI